MAFPTFFTVQLTVTGSPSMATPLKLAAVTARLGVLIVIGTAYVLL